MRKKLPLLLCFSLALLAPLSHIAAVEIEESNTETDKEDSYTTENTILLTQSGTDNYGGSSLCVTLTYDERWLTTDCKAIYNYQLAEFAVTLSSNIYEGVSCLVDGKTITDDKTVLLEDFGFTDVTQYTIDGSSYEYDSCDTTSIVIGHKYTEIDETMHDVFVVVVRGTNGTAEEWASNFDVGNDSEEYISRTGNHPEWTNHNHHKGFDVAANRVREIIDEYVANIGDSSDVTQDYLFTGHSRGAGIANLLGAEYEIEGYSSTAYTFAAPNTTTDAQAHPVKTVFNIENENDFVTTLPLSEWGFARYGTDICVDISNDDAVLEEVNRLIESEYVGADPSEMDQIFLQLSTSRDILYTDDVYEVCFETYAGKEAAYFAATTAAEELGISAYVTFENTSSTNVDGKYYYTETLCTGAYMYGLSQLMSGTRDYLGLLGKLASLELIFPSGSVYQTGLTDVLSIFSTNPGATVYPHMTVCYYTIVDVKKGTNVYTHITDESGDCTVCGLHIFDPEIITDDSEVVSSTNTNKKLFIVLWIVIASIILALLFLLIRRILRHIRR